MTDYLLTNSVLDFNALGLGGDIKVVLLDNSVQFGNQPVRVVKMKSAINWHRDMSDERHLIASVYREKEGATALKLDNEADVKNATQAGQFYRRPYKTHTNTSGYGSAGHMDHFWKPLILKNVLLDDDDDVVMGFTNEDSAFAASTQQLVFRTEAWWKRV